MFNAHPEYLPPNTEQPTAVDHNNNNILKPYGTDLINQPILFASGQFAGRTIRAELREVQQADLGRKYAKVDRRPLDPPPVVQLRFFQVYNAGTSGETEKEIADYNQVQMPGLLCTVDLFPVRQQGKIRTQSQASQSSPLTQTHLSSPPPLSRDREPLNYTSVSPIHRYNSVESLDPSMTASSTHSSPPSVPPCDPDQTVPPDIVHYIGDCPITESSKVTHALVGATVVQSVTVEYQGKKTIMFCFADLAVKSEGAFILRYRVFDIFSKPYHYTDLVIQAQCYGGMFRVYSTKEFPGLQPSTELTKQLARWGVRLNIRETERKRRRKGQVRSISPETGKRKYSSPDDDDAAYGSDDG